jgi:nicotinamidase-related amidase
MSTKALLIIDMQNESFSPEANVYDTDGVVEHINALSDRCRKAGYPVIIIQHDGTLQNEYLPGTDGWKLLPQITTTGNDILISKTANDSFYQTNLSAVLHQHHVSELILTGSATDFCMDATVHSALSRNYKVTVVQDGHTAGDRPHLKAQQVINHYNWIWSNLTPTNISVKPASEIII